MRRMGKMLGRRRVSSESGWCFDFEHRWAQKSCRTTKQLQKKLLSSQDGMWTRCVNTLNGRKSGGRGML
jgi:hypothetical protein